MTSGPRAESAVRSKSAEATPFCRGETLKFGVQLLCHAGIQPSPVDPLIPIGAHRGYKWGTCSVPRAWVPVSEIWVSEGMGGSVDSKKPTMLDALRSFLHAALCFDWAEKFRAPMQCTSVDGRTGHHHTFLHNHLTERRTKT
jgi:hypothetical protein